MGTERIADDVARAVDDGPTLRELAAHGVIALGRGRTTGSRSRYVHVWRNAWGDFRGPALGAVKKTRAGR